MNANHRYHSGQTPEVGDTVIADTDSGYKRLKPLVGRELHVASVVNHEDGEQFISVAEDDRRNVEEGDWHARQFRLVRRLNETTDRPLPDTLVKSCLTFMGRVYEVGNGRYYVPADAFKEFHDAVAAQVPA